MVNFSLRTLYPWGKRPLTKHPQDRMMGGTQTSLDTMAAKRKFLPAPGIESRSSSPQPVTKATKISRFITK
jgi:hypothetical protein